MNIFTLLGGYSSEGVVFLGSFSTKEKAEEAQRYLEEGNDEYYSFYHIDERILDQPFGPPKGTLV